MSDTPHISAVIPVYNELECLPDLRDRLLRVLRSLERTFELVFVDDGSDDGSSDLLDRYRAEDPEVRVVRLDRNWGLSSALDAGFRAARGAVTVTLDADLQNDPNDIPRMLGMLDDYDMVCGWRKDRDDPWLKRLSSKVANAIRNRLTDEDVHDTCCPLKVFKTEVMRDIRLYDGLHRFIPTLVKWEGFRVTETPVKHFPRLSGESKYGLRNRLFKGLADLRTIRWMRKNRPAYRATILD